MAQIWFGNEQHMQWVPAPLVGMNVSNAGYTAGIDYENGGSDQIRSVQTHKIYNLSFNDLMNQDVDVFNRYARGYYGGGLIYLADPFAYGNMLPANWASPALIEQGWSSIHSSVTPTYTNSSAGYYNQTNRSATFTLSAALPTGMDTRSIVIPIPPTMTLKLGFSGGVTGTGAVYYQTMNAEVLGTTSGTYNAAVALTGLSDVAAPRTNVTISGASFKCVRIALGKTGAGAGTVVIRSMLAQLDTNATAVTGNHVDGLGNSGLVFMDDAIVENYGYFYPPRKALSTTLKEVGAWR